MGDTLLWSRERPHGDGLLRGYLLLPAHLVPKKRYLVAELGDELRLVAALVVAGRRLVGVQDHEHPAPVALVGYGAALDASPDGLDAYPQLVGGLSRR
jgi:hypothetical protein